jgi:hypothetical protein
MKKELNPSGLLAPCPFGGLFPAFGLSFFSSSKRKI